MRQSAWRGLIRELRRRRVPAVALAYGALGWLVVEITATVAPLLSLPEWVPTLVVLLVLVGFPLTLVLSWLFDVTPDGVTRTAAWRPGETVPHLLADPPEPLRAVARVTSPAAKFLFPGALLLVLLGASVLATQTALFHRQGVGLRGELDVGKELVLADFVNRTDHEHLAFGITEALRIDLSRSRILTLASMPRIEAALQRMDRAPGTPFTPEVARELAVREGLDAVLTGEVAAVGSGYVILAQLVAARDGRILLSHRETARGEADVIPAVNRLSRRLRGQAGESLRDVARGEPLEAVTTRSLKALEAYSASFRTGDLQGEQSLRLLQRAVELDSTFAEAHRSLGVRLYWTGAPRTRVHELLSRAYALRDRLTERERLLAEGTYYHYAAREYDLAIGAFQEMLALNPRDYAALDHLAFLYYRSGDFTRSVHMHELLAEVNRTGEPSWNYLYALLNAGRHATADSLLVRLAQTDADGYPWLADLGWLRARQGSYVAADSILRIALQRCEQHGSRWNVATIRRQLANLRMLRGAYAEGMETMRVLATEAGSRQAELNLARALAAVDVWVAREPERARRRLDAGVAAVPLESLPERDRPLASLASDYATAGDFRHAAELVDLYDASPLRTARGVEDVSSYVARALIHLHHGRVDEARSELSAAHRHSRDPSLAPIMGLFYDDIHRPDSTAAVLEAFLEKPVLNTWMMALHAARAHEWLGSYYARQGDSGRAIHHLRQLVELWSEPDPFLQGRKTAAQRKLLELMSTVPRADGT
jgi:eukaryotic-like serine/threonine-protein kinase